MPLRARRKSWRSSRAHTRPTRGLTTRSTPHGRSLEVENAGSHCAMPGGRRTRRPETQIPRPRRREQRCARHPPRTCIHWPTLTRSSTFWGQRPTRRERPNFWRAMIELSLLITSSTLASVRHQSSLTCSAATPRHRLVEGASGSCFAIWMGPCAAISDYLQAGERVIAYEPGSLEAVGVVRLLDPDERESLRWWVIVARRRACSRR